MSHPMVERLAKVLLEWDHSIESSKPAAADYYKALALVAIFAMREPTEDMIVAGEMFSHSSSIWGAMIDAALEEPPNVEPTG